MVTNMAALNKNGIIRVIPLKDPTMKAAVLENHNKNPHALLQQSILLPLSPWRATEGEARF